MYSPEECLPKSCRSGQNQFLSNSLTPRVIVKWGIGHWGLGCGPAWERLAAVPWTSIWLLWFVSWVCFSSIHNRAMKKSKYISIGNSWMKLALQTRMLIVHAEQSREGFLAEGWIKQMYTELWFWDPPEGRDFPVNTGFHSQVPFLRYWGCMRFTQLVVYWTSVR